MSPTAKIQGTDALITVSNVSGSAEDVRVSILRGAAGENFEVIGRFSEGPESVLQLPLPKELLDGASCDVVFLSALWPGELGASIACLDETGQHIARQSVPVQPIEGAIEHFDGEMLRGWAFNPDALTERLNVDIFIDNQRSFSVAAEERRAFLVRQGKGDGRFGFSKAMPASVLDGRRHVIACRISNGGALVSPPIEVDIHALRRLIIDDTIKQIRRLERLFD